MYHSHTYLARWCNLVRWCFTRIHLLVHILIHSFQANDILSPLISQSQSILANPINAATYGRIFFFGAIEVCCFFLFWHVACFICLEKYPVNTVKMGCCQQILCKACHGRIFRTSPYCPICPKVKKAFFRNQPMDATMSYVVSLDSLPDYSGLGTIVITYHVPDGIQTQEHPNPGERYYGTQ